LKNKDFCVSWKIANGFGMVVLIASWERFRIPIALAPIDPKRKGHQNILFRQMLKDFEPPAWGREVVVVADAGYPANATLKLIKELGWTYVFAMPRTRTFTNGKYVRYFFALACCCR
jgi:hypothetical protein